MSMKNRGISRSLWFGRSRVGAHIGMGGVELHGRPHFGLEIGTVFMGGDRQSHSHWDRTLGSVGDRQQA